MGDIDDLRLQVRRLTDRAEIGDLIDRFSCDLDDYTLTGRPFDVDWVRRYFTEDAKVSYPVGEATGAAAISALIDGTGMAPFARTQHVTTNYVLDLDGDPDRVSVRFNLIATHVHRQGGDAFTGGDYHDGEVARTADGRRFTRQGLTVTWVDGRPPGTPPP
jgi:hypothetical protein